jgi:hypothetical protein
LPARQALRIAVAMHDAGTYDSVRSRILDCTSSRRQKTGTVNHSAHTKALEHRIRWLRRWFPSFQ